MEDQLLQVFSRDSAGFPLRILRGALKTAGYPAALSTGIAGEATEEELSSDTWEAAFLRWTEPELHDVALIDREMRTESDDARTRIVNALRDVMNVDDPGGQLIVADHLRRTEAIYTVQVLPALIEQDEHAAWAALDVVLRCVAAQTNGLIAVPGEGYCDAEGELLLADIEPDIDDEEFAQEEPEQA